VEIKSNAMNSGDRFRGITAKFAVSISLLGEIG